MPRSFFVILIAMVANLNRRRPGDNSRSKDSLEYYTWLAETAEKGKISSIFFADTYGFFETYGGSVDSQLRGGSHTGTIDPVAIVAAMALASKSVSFAITGSATYLSEFTINSRSFLMYSDLPVAVLILAHRAFPVGAHLVDIGPYYKRSYRLECSYEFRKRCRKANGRY